MRYVDKDLLSIQEARVLIEKSSSAQYSLNFYQQKHLDYVLDILLKEMNQQYEAWIVQAYGDLKCGCIEDEQKITKEVLSQIQCYTHQQIVGFVENLETKRVKHYGAPVGGILALLPPVNTVMNTLYAIFCAVKSGNSLVVVPHNKAIDVTRMIVEHLNKIAEENGLPPESLSVMTTVTTEGVQELVTHSEVGIVLNVGCVEYMRDIQFGQKTVYYAAIGQSPVFIEQTANVHQAVKCIIESRSCNHGILPAAEQFVVVEECIVSLVKEEFIKQGGYMMTSEEEKLLMDYIQPKNHFDTVEYIGHSPEYLAKHAGFEVPSGTKLLISSQKYIFDENPYTKEIFAPVVIVYEEPNWLTSCEKCIELLKSDNRGHTLAIHSNDPFVIKEFISKKPVGRIIVNDSATSASLGIHSTITPSFYLGGGTTGQGCMMKNITPEDFVYYREVGYTDKSNHEETYFDEYQKTVIKILDEINQL